MEQEQDEVTVCVGVTENHKLIEIHFHSNTKDPLEFERVKEAMTHVLDIIKERLHNPDLGAKDIH